MKKTIKELNFKEWIKKSDSEKWELRNQAIDMLPSKLYILVKACMNDNVWSDRQTIAFIDYYLLGFDLSEISREHGVTIERVRQIIALALKRMKHPSRIQLTMDDEEIKLANKKSIFKYFNTHLEPYILSHYGIEPIIEEVLNKIQCFESNYGEDEDLNKLREYIQAYC